MKTLVTKTVFVLVCFGFIHTAHSFSFAQNEPKDAELSDEARRTRDVSIAALDEMKEILEEFYYDPKYHNIDIKARINTAKERIKTLQFNWQMYRVLAQFLLDFDDSHTYLLMPPRPDHYDFGFEMQMIGESCFVTSLRANGGAKQAGIALVDQILMIRNFAPSRADLWKMVFVLNYLDPINKLELRVRKPDGSERAVTVKATTMTDKEFREKLKQRKDKQKTEAYKCQELSETTIACKLLTFAVEPDVIDKMMKVVAKYPKFILDLRGNGGGLGITERRLLSYFFDHEVKISENITRKKTEVEKTKSLGEKTYKGEVAVLIDSESGSASEITARVLQIEKRARIYGDVSAGAVMGSYRLIFEKVFEKFKHLYLVRLGMSVTVEDVIMSDGSRIEKIGVIPDELLKPTALGIAQKTDAVLAYAANKIGVKITPEKAGSFEFFVTEEDNYQIKDLEE